MLELFILWLLLLLLRLDHLLRGFLLDCCFLGLDDHSSALQLLLPLLAEDYLSGCLFALVLVLGRGAQVVAVADQGFAEVDLNVVGVTIDKCLLLFLKLDFALLFSCLALFISLLPLFLALFVLLLFF